MLPAGRDGSSGTAHVKDLRVDVSQPLAATARRVPPRAIMIALMVGTSTLVQAWCQYAVRLGSDDPLYQLLWLKSEAMEAGRGRDVTDGTARRRGSVTCNRRVRKISVD